MLRSQNSAPWGKQEISSQSIWITIVKKKIQYWLKFQYWKWTRRILSRLVIIWLKIWSGMTSSKRCERVNKLTYGAGKVAVSDLSFECSSDLLDQRHVRLSSDYRVFRALDICRQARKSLWWDCRILLGRNRFFSLSVLSQHTHSSYQDRNLGHIGEINLSHSSFEGWSLVWQLWRLNLIWSGSESGWICVKFYSYFTLSAGGASATLRKRKRSRTFNLWDSFSPSFGSSGGSLLLLCAHKLQCCNWNFASRLTRARCQAQHVEN